jgi:putative ABC transport system permease protein
MGWTPEEAVGRYFLRSDQQNTIIGVMKDFHMHSMHLQIEPLMISLDTDWVGYISARVSPGDLQTTIASLGTTLRQFSPYPFEYQFLDENFDQLYEAETRLGQTFGFFTILALIIASLGLFGLAAFAAEQRRKEIGIRKVLGADVSGLVALLSREFLLLVAIAFVLAAPVAYYVMHRWLENFAYRIQMGPGIFVVAGVLALVIAVATISYQSVRAALADPVKSLRYE